MPKLQPGALTRGTIRFLSGYPDLDSSAVFMSEFAKLPLRRLPVHGPQSLSISIRLLVSTTSIQLPFILPKKQKAFKRRKKPGFPAWIFHSKEDFLDLHTQSLICVQKIVS